MTPGDIPGGPTGTVSERVAQATTGLVPGGLDWARAMDELAEEFLRADGLGGRAVTGLDAAIAVRREAVGWLDGDLAATAALDLRNNLAVDLASRYQAVGGLADLLESCALSREVLAGATPGDLLTAAAGLAGRLSLLARNPGYEAELGQAIGLLDGVLEKAGHDDPDRPVVVTSLAGLEVHHWQRDGDPAALAAAATAAGVLGPQTHVVLSACDAALTAASLPDEALSPVQAAWSAIRPAFGYAPWVIVLRPHGTAGS